MTAATDERRPELSVVVPTRERPRRLAALLDSLRAQTIASGRFEVIVVDDGSGPATAEVLAEELTRGELQLRTVRRERPGGPAAARNAGWPLARAPLVAFTDDDCVVSPHWAEAGLLTAAEHPGAVIQGRLEMNPDERAAYNPFAHFYESTELGPAYGTYNIFYPRDLLERLGGFDEEAHPVSGSDTDLGWRAHEGGAPTVFSDRALAFHGVLSLGAKRRLQVALRQTNVVLNYRRHPGLRRHLILGIFWRHNHFLLARFLLALALPRRWGAVRLMLAAPYVSHLTNRRTGPLLAPYLLAVDAAEMLAIVRGAIRYRTPIL